MDIHPGMRSTKQVKVAMLTLATDTIWNYAHASTVNKQRYCDRHGYELICERLAENERPVPWTKIRLLQKHLSNYEWIFWTDADSVVTNPAIPIESFIDPWSDFVITRDHNDLNTGQFLMKNCLWSREFLEEVWEQSDLIYHEWYEQAAIIRLYPRHSQHFKVLPQHAFNSYESTWRHSDYMIHLPGTDIAARCELVPFFADLSQAIADKTLFTIQQRAHFPALLNCMGLTGPAVEVGVGDGSFSEILREHWCGDVLHLVDAWRHLTDYVDLCNLSDAEHQRNYEFVVRRMERFADTVRIHRLLSQEAIHRFADESLDFVYLDGNHSFQAVCDDLSNWYPKLRPGGILAGHDYVDGSLPEGEFGVKSAVDQFGHRMHLQLYHTFESVWQSWYLIKP